MEHNESARIHCAMRFKQRFGIELTPKLKAAFYRSIDRREGSYLVRLHNDKEIHFVMMPNVSKEPVVVVFRRDLHEIVTFMTPDIYRSQLERKHKRYVEAVKEGAAG